MKLQKRAHIDYLMGYETRIIFRIWISSQKKIIRTKDVLFNDDFIYDVHEVNLMQIINESMLKTTYNSINAQYYTHITDISDLKVRDEEKKNTKKQSNNQQTQITEETPYDSEKMKYFFTLQSFDVSINRCILTSLFSFRALSIFRIVSAFNQASQLTSSPSVSIFDFCMIGLNLNEANILPEKMKRQKASRRQAYWVSLINDSNDEIIFFHTAFSAFIFAIKFFSTATFQQKTSIIFFLFSS